MLLIILRDKVNHIVKKLVTLIIHYNLYIIVDIIEEKLNTLQCN
jgi:hypothetical protein